MGNSLSKTEVRKCLVRLRNLERLHANTRNRNRALTETQENENGRKTGKRGKRGQALLID